MIGLCCSRFCPGQALLLAYDLAISLREAGITVVCGFHTSIERDCIDFLLQGQQKIVIVPARGRYHRIPVKLRKGVKEGRVSLVYPFSDSRSRQTRELGAARNRLVVELATALFVIYAAPGGGSEEMAQLAVETGKSLLTFNIPENSGLLALGATGISEVTARDPIALGKLLSPLLSAT